MNLIVAEVGALALALTGIRGSSPNTGWGVKGIRATGVLSRPLHCTTASVLVVTT